MKKKLLAVGLILLGVAVTGGGLLWRSLQKETAPETPGTTEGQNPSPEPEEIPEIEIQTPEDKIPEEKILEESEEEEPKTTQESIAEFLAGKYDKPVEEVAISVGQETGNYASGTVKFAGEMGGGMWLAYKEGNEWIVTYDGHGTVPCSAVDPQNFPTSLASECWDEDQGKMVQR